MSRERHASTWSTGRVLPAGGSPPHLAGGRSISPFLARCDGALWLADASGVAGTLPAVRSQAPARATARAMCKKANVVIVVHSLSPGVGWCETGRQVARITRVKDFARCESVKRSRSGRRSECGSWWWSDDGWWREASGWHCWHAHGGDEKHAGDGQS